MKIFKLFILISSFITVLGCNETKQENYFLNIVDFNNKNQILLTNEAFFHKHSSLFGASSFLIEFNNTIYAVTAKHLIGIAGGVDPEILPINLPKTIKKWKMFPRVKNKISDDSVTISRAEYKNIQTNSDILLLKIEDYKGNLYKLKPTFELPQVNDSLYILGCQYSDVECRQNIYPCKYYSFDTKTNMLIFELNNIIELSGFSGAPIIDRAGHVVAVLTAGLEDNGKHFVGGTFIKEIENFKY